MTIDSTAGNSGLRETRVAADDTNETGTDLTFSDDTGRVEIFLEKLDEYAGDLSPNIDVQSAVDLILEGECLCELLFRNELGEDKIAQYQKDTMYAAAISWYLTALSIWDNREFISGSIQIVDPGYRVYNFLDGYKKAYWRESTHVKKFRDKNATRGHWKLTKATSFLGNPFLEVKRGQRGLDIHSNIMPANKRTILFGKLTTGKEGYQSTFIKFEFAGSPRVFDLKHITSPVSSIPEAIKHGGYLCSHLSEKLSDKGSFYRAGMLKYFSIKKHDQSKNIQTLQIKPHRETLDSKIIELFEKYKHEDLEKIEKNVSIPKQTRSDMKKELENVFRKMLADEIADYLSSRTQKKVSKIINTDDFSLPQGALLSATGGHIIEVNESIEADVLDSFYDLKDLTDSDEEKGLDEIVARLGNEYITYAFRNDVSFKFLLRL